jgi:CBS domain-containing protein
MKVRELMTEEVATVTLATPLNEIASKMKDEDTGAIPVLEDDKLAGIVTDRDIVIRCIAEGKDPNELTAEDILSRELETIEPDADVQEAARIMARRQIRRLPVVEDEELVGVISLGDIAVREDEDVAGDTLQDVSRGAKAGSSGKKQSRAATGTNVRTRELEDVEEETELADEARSSRQQGADRSGRATRTRAASRAQGKGQGISNRGNKQEQARQGKVAPMRAGGRGQQKKRRAS